MLFHKLNYFGTRWKVGSKVNLIHDHPHYNHIKSIGIIKIINHKYDIKVSFVEGYMWCATWELDVI